MLRRTFLMLYDPIIPSTTLLSGLRFLNGTSSNEATLRCVVERCLISLVRARFGIRLAVVSLEKLIEVLS